MKSSTIKFNFYWWLLTLSLILGYYTWFPGIPEWMFIAMVILGWVISQAIFYFSPSGEFIPKAENWSTEKWWSRILVSLYAIAELSTSSGIGAQVAAGLMPLLEILMRRFGGATDKQIATARYRGLLG